MYKEELTAILEKIKNHELSIDEATSKLENLPFENLGFANVDHHRALRRGFPEVIFCQGKTPPQIITIFKSLAQGQDVLATRVTPEIHEAIAAEIENIEYNEVARTVFLRYKKKPELKTDKQILICTAGTADIPVAEEAAVTAEVMRNPVARLYDVGVAGLHRLLNNKDALDKANVLVVVAGMDGILPTVVSGLMNKPVIAVPTSVGYGANFQGLAPLLTMLNSCSPGVTVVNIDNGFGAGYFASLINR